MNEKDKRAMIVNYFKKPPGSAFALLAIGVIVFLASANNSIGGGILVGLGLAATGGYMIYNALGNKPSDQQMDQWLNEDLRVMTTKALIKTGTDESELVSDSVQVTGPRLWDTGGAQVLYKKGGDNMLRFTPMHISVISFTKDQLIGYTCVLDCTTGKALNEGTEEYFYKDVVAVSTKTESKTVQFPGVGSVQLNAAETFTLTTSGGTSLSVLLRDPTLIEKMGGGEIPTTLAEKAIQSVRKMLREKKQS